jgi:hypothetical protein
MARPELLLKLLSNLLSFGGLLALTVVGMELLDEGEILVYCLALITTILTRNWRRRDWFYWGLTAYDVVYLVPLVAYYVLGWQDM